MLKAKRVITFSASNIVGGADYILYLITNHLGISHAILHDSVRPHANLNKKTIFHKFASLRKSISSIVTFIVLLPGALSVLRKNTLKLDTVVCNDFLALVYIAPIRCFRRLTIIYYCHAAFKPSRVNKILVSFFVNIISNKIIVPSKFLKQELTAIGIHENKIVVIYNGLPKTGHVRTATSGNPLRIGIFGGITEQKGQDTFIEAIEKVAGQQPIHAFIVGDDYDETFSAKLKAKCKNSDYITFTGFLPYEAGQQLMLTMDIIVCASKYRETLPTALIEALRAGIPVVGSETGGIPEIVLPHQNGLLFPPGNSELLAASILELRDPALRNRFGQNGIATFNERFSMDSFLDSVQAEL